MAPELACDPGRAAANSDLAKPIRTTLYYPILRVFYVVLAASELSLKRAQRLLLWRQARSFHLSLDLREEDGRDKR